MNDFFKLIIAGITIGLFFALVVYWVFYIWQTLLIQ